MVSVLVLGATGMLGTTVVRRLRAMHPALFPHELADVAGEHAAKVIHISTDAVFSGAHRTPYLEDARPDPQDVYGMSKALGESRAGNVLNLRCSIVGRDRRGRGLIEWYLGGTTAAVGGYSDSGTVVEETCVLQVPSLQMRKSTERPQVYDVGSSVKFDPAEASKYPAHDVFRKLEALYGKTWIHTFGDGESSRRIAEDLHRRVRERFRPAPSRTLLRAD